METFFNFIGDDIKQVQLGTVPFCTGGKLPKCNTPHGAKIKAGAFDAERFKCPNNS